jgi:NAD(P)H dehydrogenase (quinone)
MKNLVIYAHPDMPGFSGQALETVIKTSEAKGNEVIVRDLYKMNFNPVLTAAEMAAIQNGDTPEDIKIEQDYIREADVLTFIFPIWWADMPAILKGYIDRVFAHGFAYTYDGTGPKPLLNGKKAIIITPTGGTEEMLEQMGMLDAQKLTIVGNRFHFTGFEVLEHKYFFGNPMMTPEKVPAMLEELEELIKKY